MEPRAAPHAPTLAAVNGSLARLHRELEPLVGDVGFRALLSRALALAKREADWLDGVTIGPDGSLQGFEETQPANAPDDRARAAAALLAQALGLLVTFVGEDLTARLVTKACPETQGQDAGARVEEKSK